MKSRKPGRRKFLADGAVLAGIAVGAVRSAGAQAASNEASTPKETPARDLRAYGERSHYETSTRARNAAGGGSTYTPLQDSIGIITPSSLHYVFSRDPAPPDIDPRQHRLMIHGMVDRPLIFTMDELKRLPSVSRIHFIECVANSVPTRGRYAGGSIQERQGKTSCSEWTGVLLSLLLREAGVQKGASWLVAEGSDSGKHSMSISLEKAMDDALIAYGQNGEAIRPDQGYPLRLLVPGWEGVRNIKWLRRLKVGDEPFMTHTESTINANLRQTGKAVWFDFEMGPKSVITFPAAGGKALTGPGSYEVTGLAWSGGGTVAKVEVSTDGGRTWKNAELQSPVLRRAHTRFRLGWNWSGEEAMLQSRCTDEQGRVQPSLVEFSKFWGFTVEQWKTTPTGVTHFNPIQPWKVNRDGSIQDAMFT